MYIQNGLIYGGEPNLPIKVENVKTLPDMMMIVTFNNGETRLFDATILQGPAFEPLKDDEVFKKAIVEHGVVTWKDGEIDCAPEFMYNHGYEYFTGENVI